MDSLIKGFAKACALILIFSALSFSAPAPKTVDAVLADYAKALGGLPAIDAINTRQVSGSRSLLGKVELYWQKPNKVLMLADKARTGYDGSAGWFYSKRKRLARLPQGQQLPIEMDADPIRYVHLKQLYSEVDPAPQKSLDGVLMDVLVAPNDLAQTTFYFDAQTHLLARIDEKGDSSAYFTQTVWFDDYKPVDAIQFPFRITHKTSDKGAASEDFRVKSVKNNVTLNAEIFSKPESTNLVFGGKR